MEIVCHSPPPNASGEFRKLKVKKAVTAFGRPSPVTCGEVLKTVVVVAVESLGLREHLHSVLGVALEEKLEAVFLGCRGGK